MSAQKTPKTSAADAQHAAQGIIASAPVAPLLPEAQDEAADSTDAPTEWRHGQVQMAAHGQRLDRYLAAQVPEFSRSYIQQLIAAGAALLDDAPQSKAASKLRVGQRWALELRESAQAQAFVPQSMPIDTLYVDEHVRVIHKPAGLVVHPAAGNWSGTLLNGLLAMDAQAAQLPRAGIVHRLDKDTSGLLILARTRLAMDALIAAIAARSVQREYLALAHGCWPAHAPVREVEAAIGRDARNRLRMAVVDVERGAHGKPAHTTFTALAAGDALTLLHCKLHTGRTHQIRVHAAHVGHPLVADSLYGGRAEWGMTRQALHAWRLRFAHPISGQTLAFEAALPADLCAALDAAGIALPVAA